MKLTQKDDKGKYEHLLKLEHDEQPAKINMRTGEITPVGEDMKLKAYTGATVFNQDAKFFKGFSDAWEWLYYRLTPLELKVVMYMAMKASPVTNSLDPLGEDSSVRELSTAVDISVGKVSIVFKKLLEIGVYGKFEVVDTAKKYTKYWVLNPHLSIKSKVVKDSVVKLFDVTELSQAMIKLK